MSFIDTRLPTQVEINAIRRDPESEGVEIVTTDSGGEVRNLRHADSKLQFDISFPTGDKSGTLLAAVRAMFKVAYGSLYAFRFRDFTEDPIEDELLGVGTGGPATFDLVLNYLVGSTTRTRRIRRPVDPIVIKIEGVVQTTGYTVNYSAGTVSLDSVDLGDEVTWSGDYDIAVRFDSALTMTQLTQKLTHLDTVTLIEVLDE